MALMRWGKYYVNSEVEYTNPRSTGGMELLNRYGTGSNGVWGYTSYGFDSSIGFYVDGSYVFSDNVIDIPSGSSGNEVHILAFDPDSSGSGGIVNVYRAYICDQTYTYSKGNFIEEVTAEAGTYPTDGRSGSYWYTLIGSAESFASLRLNNNGVGNKGKNVWLNNNDAGIKATAMWINDNGTGVKIL